MRFETKFKIGVGLSVALIGFVIYKTDTAPVTYGEGTDGIQRLSLGDAVCFRHWSQRGVGLSCLPAGVDGGVR